MSKVKKKSASLSTSSFVDQLMMNSSYDSFGKKISVAQAPAESAADPKDKKKMSKPKESMSNLDAFQDSGTSKHSVTDDGSRKSHHRKKEEGGDSSSTASDKKQKKASKHQDTNASSAESTADDTKNLKGETTIGDPVVPTSSPTKSKLFSKRRPPTQPGGSSTPSSSSSSQQAQAGGDALGEVDGAQQAVKKDEMKLYYDKHNASKDEDSDSGDDYYFDAMGDVIDDDHHRAPLGYETVVKMDGWIRKTLTDKSNRWKERKERDNFESEQGSEHNRKTIIPNIFLLGKKKKVKGTTHKKSGSGISDDISVCTDDSSDMSQPARSFSQPPAAAIFGDDSGNASCTPVGEEEEGGSEENIGLHNKEDAGIASVDGIDKGKKERASKELRSVLRKSRTTTGRLTQLERRVGEAEACMPGKVRDDVFALSKTLDESARDLREFMNDPEFERFMDGQRKEVAQTEESVAALVAECEGLVTRTQRNTRNARVLRTDIREFSERMKDPRSAKRSWVVWAGCFMVLGVIFRLFLFRRNKENVSNGQ